MNATSTILSTKTAVINGIKATVETIKLTGGRSQDIMYNVAGKLLTGNEFWSLNPRFKN